ncbi:hypothetical protein [Rhodomicrobium lacus]|uniref:hypothetical protein n=1 Tax=Rhodomicrobium lacus TaxID=2498452 RepID=UPI0026E41854|nr:hypothetical protein [Rhodomicrobium lacus]WKW51894.1 hypothetical protein QMO75_05285 [Rhodomicrobium lacus]
MSQEDAEEIASIVSSYLDSYKRIEGDVKWKNKGHPDYIQLKIPIVCPSMPEIDGQLIMTAHRTRIPHRFSFTIVAGSNRIVGLDVNPASSHFNVRTRKSVSVTHWQWFPVMDAEADERNLLHLEWFREFCQRTKIEIKVAYAAPPHEPVQLDLL